MAGGNEQAMVRAVRNQMLYREVNEKLRDLNAIFTRLLDGRGTWICECADRDCTEPLEMTLEEYERLRTHPNRFAVLPGHADVESGRVVEEHEDYIIIATIGGPATDAVARRRRAGGRASRPTRARLSNAGAGEALGDAS